MIFKDRFLKNNILMFFSTSLANAANLLCQVVIVRMLTVSDYGAFNSLLSIFMIISLPINSMNTMVVKFASAYNHRGQRKEADLFLNIMFRHMLFAGMLFLVGYLIFSPHFKNYLRLDSIAPVYLTGGMLFITILLTVPLGGLQGFERFKLFGVSLISGGIFKLLLVFIFLSLGWGLLGALGGHFMSQLTVLLISLIALKGIFYPSPSRGSDVALKEKYAFVIPSIIAFGCTAILTNIDVIFVKHYFSPVETGRYSIAQMIGKIVFFVPGAIYLVMLPGASGLHAREKDSRQLLKRSIKYVTVLCLVVIAAYNIFPRQVLGVLTDKVNDEIIFLGRLFSVIGACFALVASLSLYHLSVSRFDFLKWLILFTVFQVAAILIFHVSLSQVLFIILINSFILLIINFRLAMKK